MLKNENMIMIVTLAIIHSFIHSFIVFATSNDPRAVKFREHMKNAYGLDMRNHYKALRINSQLEEIISYIFFFLFS